MGWFGLSVQRRRRIGAAAAGHQADNFRDASKFGADRDVCLPNPYGWARLEGDLIIGLERSAIGTLVDRTIRFTILVHLPREDGYGVIPRTRNGPALAGYGAISMKNALAATISSLPQQLRRSLAWDRGKELTQHARLTRATGMPVYFADPHSPWQRGTDENTNGLLRQYFPKSTDLARWSTRDLDAVADTLNNRPRKTLGWKIFRWATRYNTRRRHSWCRQQAPNTYEQQTAATLPQAA